MTDTLDEFASVIHVARLIYAAAEETGTSETALHRLGRIAALGYDTIPGAHAVDQPLHPAARTAALDELHAWAWVEHTSRGHVATVECGICCAELAPALLPFCDHGYGPAEPAQVTR